MNNEHSKPLFYDPPIIVAYYLENTTKHKIVEALHSPFQENEIDSKNNFSSEEDFYSYNQT